MPQSRNRPRSNPHPIVKRVLQPLGRVLQGPYGIAAIASLSFHGVVFALGPTLAGVSIAPFDEGFGDDIGERTVPLVELSEAEQGRLPDFSARRSFTGRLPVPSTTPPSLPIQRTPQRSRLGSRPQRSTSIRRSSPFIGQRTAPSSGQNSNRRSSYIWDSSRIIRPPNIETIPNRSTVESPPEEETASTTTTGPDTPNEATAPSTTTTAAAETDGTAGLDLETLQNPQSIEGGDAPENESSNETPSEGESGNDGTEPENLDSNETDAYQLLRDSLRWDATDTEAGDVEVSAWIAELQAADESIVAAEVAQGIDSNIRVCVETPPTDAIVGVLVQPDGTTNATLIKRTGYAATDQAALNAATVAAAQSETPTAYRVNIEVGYDAQNCTNPTDVLE